MSEETSKLIAKHNSWLINNGYPAIKNHAIKNPVRKFKLPDENKDLTQGNRLRRNIDIALAEKGWSYYRLEKESGVFATTIRRLGKTCNTITADSLARISIALDISMDELYGLERR